MSVWVEVFFGSDVGVLKERALQLHAQLERGPGWFEKRRVRAQIIRILDEIEYQEGRKQYANRPYTFPPASVRLGCKGTMSCRCWCWLKTREAIGF